MKKQQSALTSFSLKAHFNWWTKSGFSREWSCSWNRVLISLSLRQVDPPLALNKFKFDLLPIRPNGLCLRPLLAVSTTISLSHHIMYPSQSLLAGTQIYEVAYTNGTRAHGTGFPIHCMHFSSPSSIGKCCIFCGQQPRKRRIWTNHDGLRRDCELIINRVRINGSGH